MRAYAGVRHPLSPFVIASLIFVVPHGARVVDGPIIKGKPAQTQPPTLLHAWLGLEVDRAANQPPPRPPTNFYSGLLGHMIHAAGGFFCYLRVLFFAACYLFCKSLYVTCLGATVRSVGLGLRCWDVGVFHARSLFRGESGCGVGCVGVWVFGRAWSSASIWAKWVALCKYSQGLCGGRAGVGLGGCGPFAGGLMGSPGT